MCRLRDGRALTPVSPKCADGGGCQSGAVGGAFLTRAWRAILSAISSSLPPRVGGAFCGRRDTLDPIEPLLHVGDPSPWMGETRSASWRHAPPGEAVLSGK